MSKKVKLFIKCHMDLLKKELLVEKINEQFMGNYKSKF